MSNDVVRLTKGKSNTYLNTLVQYQVISMNTPIHYDLKVKI